MNADPVVTAATISTHDPQAHFQTVGSTMTGQSGRKIGTILSFILTAPAVVTVGIGSPVGLLLRARENAGDTTTQADAVVGGNAYHAALGSLRNAIMPSESQRKRRTEQCSPTQCA